jgi:integrase
MASIYKRKNNDGTTVWRAVIRIKGYPTLCNHFERKQEAEDWAHEAERKIKLGQFKFDQHKQQHTFQELVTRYKNDGILEHHRSAKDTRRHLDYWSSRFGSYALIHITTDLISKERQLLASDPNRSPATINRYFASLSSLLTYATKKLHWITENPCLNLKKLKEKPGRDRVLTEEEIKRLLSACRESRSPYLFPIVLISLTTGARQGEILSLEWKNIDFKNKLAHLKETKNGRPRSISLSDPVIAELKKLHDSRNPLKPLVFASKTALGRVDIKKAWKQALKRADISHCRAHDMRHTFCTLAASQGASNLELATAMGHRTLEMLQRYTHLDTKVTKKLSKHISEKILQGDPQ